eukprot:1146101-Pelagomonas_calceolata.AAC.2
MENIGMQAAFAAKLHCSGARWLDPWQPGGRRRALGRTIRRGHWLRKGWLRGTCAEEHLKPSALLRRWKVLP